MKQRNTMYEISIIQSFLLNPLRIYTMVKGHPRYETETVLIRVGKLILFSYRL
jgi:hypothetical protein